MMWNDSQAALSQKFTHRQSDVSMCVVTAWKPFPCIPLFVAHFPAKAVRCQCSNAGLQFILVQQTRTARSLSVVTRNMSLLFTFAGICLAFFSDVEMTRSSNETTAAWFLGNTCESASHHLWLSSKGTILLLLHTKRGGGGGAPI
jgi:hypothetical protein